MSLNAALNIGQSALSASSLGIQIAGNNIANVSTPGYSRQLARLVPLRGDSSSWNVGSGVGIAAVQRQVDEAIEARLRTSTASAAYASAQSTIYSQVEDTLGELGKNDLSSQLSSFFSAWSERANQTNSNSSVVQQGDQLAAFLQNLRGDLVSQRSQIQGQLAGAVTRADQLLSSIADLNGQISQAEVGGQPANTLRDQRNSAVKELSGLIDVSVVDRGQGGFDVLTGSTPLVLGSQSRGITLKHDVVNGQQTTSVATKVNSQTLTPGSGQIAAFASGSTSAIDDAISRVDGLASTLIYEVNKFHATGANAAGLTTTSSTAAFTLADRSRAFNDPANQSAQDLAHAPTNGGFIVRVRNTNTGAEQTVRVNVDLDGINNAGQPGTADDTSPEGLRAQLDGITGISATFSPDGKLQVNADQGFEFNFEDDTSNALASLGVNAYFTGGSAKDIAVRSDLKTDPNLLTAGRYENGAFVENGTALALAGLQDQGVASLGGQTIQQSWRDSYQSIGAGAAQAKTLADAAGTVRDSLESQRSAVSGVSIDEESINLLSFQNQYSAAAKLISVTDQLTQTVINLV
ncbi:MAG: flagellar hook-associated protein FlgK [Tepidisphaera sp.]|nr:flagellar hook-associated protein FlgK [Tepidisphaera sp.]